jgi:hypothetical protein
MLKEGLSRRQFVGGTAALMGAAAMPTIASVSVAAADPGWRFPIAATQTEPWIPLDPVAAAREALEIYRGMRLGQAG